jgi:predicted DNA-binding protein (MmcQ/YjbR family)
MDIEAVRKYCLSLPHATENIQWGNNLLFRIGKKMFAIMALDTSPVCISFKCTPEEFAELVERVIGIRSQSPRPGGRIHPRLPERCEVHQCDG